MMISRMKSFFFVVVFMAAASIHSLPQDNATSSLTDEGATIQPNPNYTEPQAVSEDIVEATEEKNEEVGKVDTPAEDEEQLIGDAGDADEVDEEGERHEMNGHKVVSCEDVSEEDEDLDDDYESADEYDEEEDEDEDDKESKESVKQVLAQALSKSRKVSSRSLAFVKKHRVKLTIAAVLFAFRNEIKLVFVLMFTKPKEVDPESGKVISRTLNISPTAVLKLLLFLDFLRKLKSGDVSEAGTNESFWYKLLHSGNTAYVPPVEQHWTFEKMNERYDKDNMAYQKATSSGLTVGMSKTDSLRSLATLLLNSTQGQKDDLVIILDWTKLTESIDQMSSLSDQVSFILSQHRTKNNVLSTASLSNATSTDTVAETTEIIVLLESPGGAAADYGLASQMMMRLSHEPGLVVTVCVDKVAASGGYMIACASSPGRLYAAPFAVLGSIGVVGSSINIHNVLRGWGVKPLVFRGGKHKAPVGLIGEVTTDGMKQVQNMVDATHVAFKRHVVAARPVLAENIDKVASGQVWLAYEALKVHLIDRIITSDEYIGERILEGARVLRLVKYHKPRFMFSAHGPRLSPINVIRSTLKTMLVDVAHVFQRACAVQDMPMVAADHRLTATAASLASSIQSTKGKVP